MNPSDYNFKLSYFGIAGKAEALRWAFNYLNIPFEDDLLNGQTFGAKKAAGEFKFGQVPVLYVWKKSEKFEDAQQLVQSVAIIRFISKLVEKNSFYPSCPIAAAKVDAILDQEADCFSSYRAVNYKDRNGMKEMSQEEQQKYKTAINNEVIKSNFEKLEKILSESSTNWIAGTEGPSIADFFWAASLMAVQRGWTGDKTVVEGFPKLNALVDRVLALEEMKEYYKNHEFKIWW